MNRCSNCNKETTNPKFCSRSCAASHNNKLYQKRNPAVQIPCFNCGKSVPKSSKRKRCSDCISVHFMFQITLGEYRSKFTTLEKCYNAARSISRNQYLGANRPLLCAVCKYDKHVDICHVIDLCNLPDKTPLHKAISNGNLIALCKNHHWEFDHDIL